MADAEGSAALNPINASMSQTIPPDCHRTPMWVYEQNYALLRRLLPFLQEAPVGTRAVARHADGRVIVTLLENSPYTQVLALCQDVQQDSDYLQALDFHVRLYDDARVAEVIRYQDQRRLRGRYPYPNARMYQPDEKRQSNLLLHDWLCLLHHRRFELDEACHQAC